MRMKLRKKQTKGKNSKWFATKWRGRKRKNCKIPLPKSRSNNIKPLFSKNILNPDLLKSPNLPNRNWNILFLPELISSLPTLKNISHSQTKTTSTTMWSNQTKKQSLCLHLLHLSLNYPQKTNLPIDWCPWTKITAESLKNSIIMTISRPRNAQINYKKPKSPKAKYPL